MTLRDILIGGETEVIEHTATLSIEEGEIIYGQLWKVAGLDVLGCSAPFRIPSRRLADILVLRKKLRKKIAKSRRELGAADLVRFEDDVREAYLNIRDILHTPPRFANTDGDPLLFHTLTFQIGSPGVAFEALAPLAWGYSREDLLSHAELDDDGAIRGVEFDWIKKGNRKIEAWDNTILGHIKISGQTLTADVTRRAASQRNRKAAGHSGGSPEHQGADSGRNGKECSRASYAQSRPDGGDLARSRGAKTVARNVATPG